MSAGSSDNINAGNRPVNLHPLFLFWKHGSVCDPEKKGSKIWVSKSRVKKTRSLLFKKRRGSCPLLFLNNNDPVFCTLLFASHIFDLIFFQGHKPTHVFKTRIVGTDWLGEWVQLTGQIRCISEEIVKKSHCKNCSVSISQWIYFNFQKIDYHKMGLNFCSLLIQISFCIYPISSCILDPPSNNTLILIIPAHFY